MKKIFTLAVMALLFTTGASAQTLRKTWDFRDGFSQQTVNALKGDQAEFGTEKYWRNWEKSADAADEQHFWNASTEAKNAEGYACTHNGGQEKVIPELEGLKVGMSAAKKFVITYDGAMATDAEKYANAPENRFPYGPSYVWLNGKNETITFQAEQNQTIRIAVESHKDSEARGITLSTDAGTLTPNFEGNSTPIFYTEYEWNLAGDAGTVANVTLKSTNGCHIYYIIVGSGDGPDLNKKKIGYLTAGDATAENAYQALAADETLLVTPIDAATFTAASQLADFDATVVSATLPADNAAVATLKEAIAFYPIVNLNPSLYAAWGYGEAADSEGPIALVNDKKNMLFSGLDEENFVQEDESLFLLELSNGVIQTVKLGDFFAGDVVPLSDAFDAERVMAHLHNPYHNAYIYVPCPADATERCLTIVRNAVDMARSSKSEIMAAPAPKIIADYKNMSTNVSLAMASTTLPKPQIFFTLDGSEPTEASTLYTEPFTLTSEATVKAVAKAEGYLLSPVAEMLIEMKQQAPVPAISVATEGGKATVTVTSELPDAVIYYNFSGSNAENQSGKYTEPIVLTKNRTIYAFVGCEGYVNSEVVSQEVTVDETMARTKIVAHMDANSTDYNGGSTSTGYYFSWGKNKNGDNGHPYYNTTEGVEEQTTVDPETGDEIVTKVYTILNDEEEKDFGTGWIVRSRGQIVDWENLSSGTDYGNSDGYNYASPLDDNPDFPATKGCIVLAEKNTDPSDASFPYNAYIVSAEKFAGPFDIVANIGSIIKPGNSANHQVVLQVATDGNAWDSNWQVLGDTIKIDDKNRLTTNVTRSYEGTDEVYVRAYLSEGNSKTGFYDIYIATQAEMDGITTVNAATLSEESIYGLNGVRRQELRRGVNIVVGRNGQVKKVLVK